MSSTQRASTLSSSYGEEIMRRLTPSQYAALFPRYYRRMMPKLNTMQASTGAWYENDHMWEHQSSGGNSYSPVDQSTPTYAPPSTPTGTAPATQTTPSKPSEKATAPPRPNIPESASKTNYKPFTGKIRVDQKGNANKQDFYDAAVTRFANSPLNGFVPADGKKYGIDGSPQSWAKFAVRVANQESSFNVNTTNLNDPGGSYGIFQFGNHYGINQKNKDDPHAQLEAFVNYADQWVVNGGGHIQPPQGVEAKRYRGHGGFAAAFGSVRRDEQERERHHKLANELAKNAESYAASTEQTQPTTASPATSTQEKAEEKSEYNYKLWDDMKVPTSDERAKIQQSGGTYVSLDTNDPGAKSSNRSAQLNPLFIIPPNATEEQRAAAQAYVDGLAAHMNEQFGSNLKGVVRTSGRGQNGRANTFHTEPFNVHDEKSVKYFTQTEEGRRFLARHTADTIGKLPGVEFSLPHLNTKGKYNPEARGASGKWGNEVDFARIAMRDMQDLKAGTGLFANTGSDTGKVQPTQDESTLQPVSKPTASPATDEPTQMGKVQSPLSSWSRDRLIEVSSNVNEQQPGKRRGFMADRSKSFKRSGDRLHAGNDYFDAPGTSAKATEDGVVIRAQNQKGYGGTVDVLHTAPDGSKYVTRYGHLNTKFPVKPGDTIKAGQDLGTLDKAKHLHFEVRDYDAYKKNPFQTLNHSRVKTQESAEQLGIYNPSDYFAGRGRFKHLAPDDSPTGAIQPAQDESTLQPVPLKDRGLVSAAKHKPMGDETGSIQPTQDESTLAPRAAESRSEAVQSPSNITPERRINPEALEEERPEPTTPQEAPEKPADKVSSLSTGTMKQTLREPYLSHEQWGSTPTPNSFVRATEQSKGRRNQGAFAGSRFGEEQISTIV